MEYGVCDECGQEDLIDMMELCEHCEEFLCSECAE